MKNYTHFDNEIEKHERDSSWIIVALAILLVWALALPFYLYLSAMESAAEDINSVTSGYER